MAAVTVMRTPAETGLGELFERLKGGLPGDVAVREAALSGFGARGLPHRRVEEFKYFDLRALMREAAPPSERPAPDEIARVRGKAQGFAGVDAARIVFVNGFCLAAQSDPLPAGVSVVSMADALTSGHPLLGALGAVAIARDNPIYQLNTAFMADGAIVEIAPGTVVDRPLMLQFLNTGSAPFSAVTRVLVMAGDGASATVLESHEGPDGLVYQTNVATEFVAGEKAKLRHLRVNAEGGEALALSSLTAKLGAGVSFDTLSLVTGSAAARHQVFLTFSGERSEARIDGVSLLRRSQHADSTLVVDHAVPHCTSRETFKTILDDLATGVFQGKTIVRPHAQKTDGGMKSDALLLSDGATMNNKPELEIFADDVVCGHGATCGALDEDLLFYLKSRGLPKAEAESLLLQAFVGPPLEAVEHEGAREALVGIVEGWLAERG